MALKNLLRAKSRAGFKALDCGQASALLTHRTSMTSAHSFLNRQTQEPIFVGEDPRTLPPGSSMEPKPGDIATLHTVDDAIEIKITTASDRSYLGDIVAATNRHSHAPLELQGIQSATFTYAQIISIASSFASGRAGQ